VRVSRLSCLTLIMLVGCGASSSGIRSAPVGDASRTDDSSIDDAASDAASPLDDAASDVAGDSSCSSLLQSCADVLCCYPWICTGNRICVIHPQ
jgi:hypothetical protein